MSLRKSSSVGINGCTFQPPDVGFDALQQVRRPAVLRDQRHQRAADHRRVGVGRHFGDVLGTRNAEAQRDRQRRVRADPFDQRLGARGDAIARPGHAQPRNAIQEPAPELGRLPDPLVRRRRAQQEDRIKTGGRERFAEPSRLFYRQIEREHPVHAGRRRRLRKLLHAPCAAAGWRS